MGAMKKLTRRTFGRWIGAFAAATVGKSLFPKPALGGAKPRVVVIGGGAAGNPGFALSTNFLVCQSTNLYVAFPHEQNPERFRAASP